ncbi:ATP-binding protein [Actinomadura sp. SCN-SB]|uniref:ATP-binding protein n=1 Tax=Actinomadura sp. SCN-SB TaxID=3373092 RepID=UPI00375313D5
MSAETIIRALDGIYTRGAAILLRGPAGIGKSALLAEARRRAAERGVRVLTTAGVRAESGLAFAGLHRLLRPLLDRVDDLPAPQRDALRTAFGMAETVTTPAPFLIGLGTLGLLGAEAAREPLLLTVEDAQWLDRPAADALAFAGRRLGPEAIVLIAALRDGYESPLREAGPMEVRLGGLTREAARRLLTSRFPDLPPGVRERVLDEADGNPLALLELPRALDPAGPGEEETPPARLPLTPRLQRAFGARAAELPAPTRTVLRVAALEEDCPLAPALAAAGIVDGAPRGVEHLAPAVRAELIETDDRTVRFRHPLYRAAIRQAASLAERHAAHRALAEALEDDPDRRVWHLAEAAVGPDEAVAAELAEAGRRALRRGAIGTAEAAFERAAALARDPARRGRLLLDAAAAANDRGRGRTVLRLLRETENLELGPEGHAYRMWIEDDLPLRDTGRVRALVDAARAGDRDLALHLLMAAAARCYWGDLRDEGRAVLRAADALGVACGDDRLLCVQALAAPIERAPSVLGGLHQAVPGEDPTALYSRAIAAFVVGAFDQALPLLSAAARRLREQGRVRMLAHVLPMQAWAALEVGDFGVAASASDEASGTGRPLWQAAGRVAGAGLAALRGDRAGVERLTAEAERVALPAGATALLALVQHTRGRLELAEARHAAAYEQLRRIFEPGDPAAHAPARRHAIGDFAEAAARSGHRDEALARLTELERDVPQAPASWAHAQSLFAKAQLAATGDGGAAERAFRRALGEGGQAPVLTRARLLLTQGEWLRRRRRLIESRAPLRAARDAFDALGTGPWAERARRELRATGERSRRRARHSPVELTQQELQIVRMAAQGLSNREIAQRLYLSHRTIESHLYRVFPKLGVASRAELAGALGEHPS